MIILISAGLLSCSSNSKNSETAGPAKVNPILEMSESEIQRELSSDEPPSQADEDGFYPLEKKSYEALSSRVQKAMQLLYQSKTAGRGFHPKIHACLEGSLKVKTVPGYNFGIFNDPDRPPYDVWVRLSNGLPFDLPDQVVDFRGLAIKVRNVSGVQLLKDREKQLIQDFLFLNSPTTVLGDPEEVVQLLETLAGVNRPFDPEEITNVLSLISKNFQLKKIRAAVDVVRQNPKFLKVTSLATQTYYSAGPLKLGADPVKLVMEPCKPEIDPLFLPKQKDFLREDLVKRLKTGPMNFCLKVQRKTPKDDINDGTSVWKGPLSPAIAELTLFRQTFNSPEKDQMCQKMAFTPWNGIKEHEPLGMVQRSRRFLYEASQKFRDAEIIHPK